MRLRWTPHLELDLGTVEQSIEAYLQDPSVALRRELLAVLEHLDEQIDQSDAYESSGIGSAAFGYSAKGAVVGETSSASAAEDVPESVLRRADGLGKGGQTRSHRTDAGHRWPICARRIRPWPSSGAGGDVGADDGLARPHSKLGRSLRVRLSSKKPSVPVHSSTPSHRRPAASPLGAGVTTGPKMAWPL